MKKTSAPGHCHRQSLNEVLAAELNCLRPGNRLYGSPDPDGPKKVRSRPASYDDDPETRAADLKEIYQAIGNWSELHRTNGSATAPLSALCLSGGGIRSATFNLGVLQGLARIGLLGKFDYLSSVSGGGYIASWLRAWMHRRGVENVVGELAKGPCAFAPLAPEPQPVSNLREYSNYLTPLVGLFSGDLWSVAATIARNLLLNWLMLLPLLGAVIGIPLLFLLVIRTPELAEQWSVAILSISLLIELVASAFVYGERRFGKNPGISQGRFIVRCVLPVCLAAGTLATAAIGLGLPWADLEPHPTTVDWYKLWGFCATWCIGVPILGWVTVELIARHVNRARWWITGKDQNLPLSDEEFEQNARHVSIQIELIALLVSGSVGTLLLAGLVTGWLSFLFNHPALYAILVLPILLGIYLLSRVVFVGLASIGDERPDTTIPAAGGIPAKTQPHVRNRIYSNDADREWWSRLSGWILLVITSWTAVTGICLLGCYLPENVAGLIHWVRGHTVSGNSDPLATVVKWVVGAVGAVSGLMAALTGSGSKTPATAGAQASATPKATARLLAITGPLFVVCLIMAISWSVKGIGEILIASLPLADLRYLTDPSNLFKFDFDLAGNRQPLPASVTLSFLAVIAGLALLGLVASRFVNVNRFSLHGMYRNRLVRAYLGASNCAINGAEQRIPDPFTGFALSDNFPLHQLCDCPTAQDNVAAQSASRRIEAPLSIINTTLNLVHGERLAWQQRKAASFSMTPLFCGNWQEGYRSSSCYGGPDGITVGTAVTISGAAANPNMGYCSSPVLGFLMTMFNVRLGAWLGNTNCHGDHTYDHPGPRFALLPLFAEMLGLTNSKRRYVNLSDGGHFDNLGLYEAVLRRCRYILVSDVGRDGAFTFEDLGSSIRKIRIDFGIEIEFETIQILPNTSATHGLYCALGHIRYSKVDCTRSQDDGLLIYIKPTLRGPTQIPYDIYSYSQACKEFPHETTVDQWFSESQFESYRALGAHIVDQLAGNVAKVSQQRPSSNSGLFERFYDAVNDYVKPRESCAPALPEKSVTVQVEVPARQSPPEVLAS